jgi:hypothetical protein
MLPRARASSLNFKLTIALRNVSSLEGALEEQKQKARAAQQHSTMTLEQLVVALHNFTPLQSALDEQGRDTTVAQQAAVESKEVLQQQAVDLHHYQEVIIDLQQQFDSVFSTALTARRTI